MMSKKWFTILIISLGLIFVGNLAFFAYTYVFKKPTAAQTLAVPQVTLAPTTTVEPTREEFGSIKGPPTPTPTPTPRPVLVFDKALGNNYYAAKYAASLSAQLTKAFGASKYKSVSVHYDPEDIGNFDEFSYYTGALKTASITVVMDPTSWSSTPDYIQSAFVSALVKTQKLVINVYPQVTITDGSKTVATGVWSDVKSDVVVTMQ